VGNSFHEEEKLEESEATALSNQTKSKNNFQNQVGRVKGLLAIRPEKRENSLQQGGRTMGRHPGFERRERKVRSIRRATAKETRAKSAFS